MIIIPQKEHHNILLGIDFFLKQYNSIKGIISTVLYFNAIESIKNNIVKHIFFFLIKKYNDKSTKNIKYISLWTLLSNSTNTNGFIPYNSIYLLLLVNFFIIKQFIKCIINEAILNINNAIVIFPKDKLESTAAIVFHTGPYTLVVAFQYPSIV